MTDDTPLTGAKHPAFTGFTQVVPLTGFSGAQIALLRQSGKAPFVRKAASLPEGNAGIVQQAQRQHWLRNELDGAANVPMVLGEGQVDGLQFFDMEFIPSRDANAFLRTAPLADIARFADRVEALMRHQSSRMIPISGSPQVTQLFGKLDQIELRTRYRYSALLAPIRTALELLREFPVDTGATTSHGDLTFENILVNASGEVWLIDPIQSPIDHYWMDWAKLFQECEGHWHLHRGKLLPAGVTHWLRQRWLAGAARLSPEYQRWHHTLLALTFARILPYAKETKDADFVAGRVQRFGAMAVQAIRG